MFSSNPFPYLPSSTNNLFLPPNSNSNSLFDHYHHQKDDNFHFNFHQRTIINDVVCDPFISGDHFLDSGNPPPVIMEEKDFVQLQQQHQETVISQERLMQNNNYCQEDLLDSVISRYKKKSVTTTTTSSKKHGHSKICTARGPRDRRVRFSIEVAQKFFSLQDLLGFDKASKTLDWLLTNSMPAIKELINQESGENSSSNSTSEVTHQYNKLRFLEAINNGEKKKSAVIVQKSCASSVVAGKKKKSSRRKLCKNGVINVARDQSRAEARARARERTREKLRNRIIMRDEVVISPSDLTLKSADCWSEIDQQQIDYKNIRWN